MSPPPYYLFLLLLVASLLSDHTAVLGFAAKKKPNNKNKKKTASASNIKGFGAAPPTLEEVASKFKVRLPENAGSLPCPCGVTTKDTLYQDCCQPYHLGQQKAETPLDVLKTRYSAFCYRLVPYIIETTHPTCRDYRENIITWAKDLNRDGMFDSFEFMELVPGETQFEDENDNKATIDFQVRLRARGSNGEIDEKGEETIVSEKSVFLKDPQTNVWTYSTGEVRSEVAGLEDAILNQ